MSHIMHHVSRGLLVMHARKANKIYAYVNQYAFFEMSAYNVHDVPLALV